MRLLRRFTCAQCGATGPVDSPAPYVRCESCSAVGDFDWGAARRHPEWPAHEAMTHALLTQNKRVLDQARVDANRKGWSEIYEAILYALVAKFPALYPPRARERDYLARFITFQTAFHMVMAIEPPLLDGELALDTLRPRVKYQNGIAHPETLWPLVDQALRYFAVQEQFGYAAPPPEDFAPRYVSRSATSAFVADWLPKLSVKVQRELVARLGVSAEYLEPRGNDVTCRTCGGTTHVDDGVDKSACRYCGADIHVAVAGHTARAEGLAMMGEVDKFLADAMHMAKGAHAPVEVIEVLDGPVLRGGKPFRLVELVAVSAKRREVFWIMHDVPDSLDFRDLFGWLDGVAAGKGIPHRTVPYREHPRCMEVAKAIDELAQRLFQVAPGHTRADVRLTIYSRGIAAEVVDGGAVVRIALASKGGDAQGTIKKWLKA